MRRSVLSGRRWAIVGVIALIWAAVVSGVGGEVVNPGGWPQWQEFWAAALAPRLDAEFLAVVADAAVTTVAFATVGTAIAVVIGLVGGALTSETWWRSEGRSRRRGERRPQWWILRGLAALPRGVHEAVWGLGLAMVLGRDPLVGVLAIAIPFGAITAKVFAEIIDDTPHEPYDSIRAGGAGRLVALGYGILPAARGALISYSFYRLECAIRSAVILGIIGAGGLGFELALSFQSLNYDEMWTLIAAIAILSALADWWSTRLRLHPSSRGYRVTAIAVTVLLVGSIADLGLGFARVWDPATRALMGDLIAEAWPPALPRGGWPVLFGAVSDTLSMSILAIALAGTVGAVLAFVAARHGGGLRRAVASACRVMMLVLRSIPPPVWALVLLFVFYPGPIPGALALGVYNLGILGRLMAESVEHLDARPAGALDALGAPNSASFAYATLPQATPRLVSLSMYRWEVAIKETVVVGLVGAGGLGRLLALQSAAFDQAAITTTVLALVFLSLVVDLISASVRRSIR